MIDVLYLLGGLCLLTVGGELLIRSSLTLARRLGISPMLTGLIIVGFGTSAPELAVSIDAAMQQKSDIAIGNVVGSNIGNALLILGICAIIAPLVISKLTLIRDGLVVLLSTSVFIIASYDGILDLYDGLLFLVLLAAYMVYVFISESKKVRASESLLIAEANEVQKSPKTMLIASVGIGAGLTFLIIGAQCLLSGASEIALVFGVSEALIGLSIVAVGTSLPELTVSVIATIRGHADVAVGNVLGSNIFNILGILAVSAIVQPLSLSTQIAGYDRWALLATMLLMCILLYTGRRIQLSEGIVMLCLYVVYMAVGIMMFG